MVPKSLYRTAEELESEENRLLTDSIYKSASIFKGAPYEVPHLCIRVSESEAAFIVLIYISNLSLCWILYCGLGCHQVGEVQIAVSEKSD